MAQLSISISLAPNGIKLNDLSGFTLSQGTALGGLAESLPAHVAERSTIAREEFTLQADVESRLLKLEIEPHGTKLGVGMSLFQKGRAQRDTEVELYQKGDFVANEYTDETGVAGFDGLTLNTPYRFVVKLDEEKDEKNVDISFHADKINALTTPRHLTEIGIDLCSKGHFEEAQRMFVQVVSGVDAPRWVRQLYSFTRYAAQLYKPRLRSAAEFRSSARRTAPSIYFSVLYYAEGSLDADERRHFGNVLAHFKANRLDEALRRVVQLPLATTRTWTFPVIAGALYGITNDFNAAKSHFENALAQQPDNALIHAALGWTEIQRKRYDTANHHFERAYGLDPQNSDVYLGREFTRRVMHDENHNENDAIIQLLVDLLTEIEPTFDTSQTAALPESAMERLAAIVRRDHEALGLIQNEMELARSIQERLLPQTTPQVKGYSFAGCNVPCKEVGGDYYDFVERDEARTCIVVSDVSGKGLAAGMLMSNFHAALRGQLLRNSINRATMCELNDWVRQNSLDDMFITAFLAELDTQTGLVRYSNAGHDHPLLIRSNGDVTELDTGGLLLGMFSEADYDEGHTQLDLNDVLVLYTDGVTDRLNGAGEMYSKERLIANARQHRRLDAEGILQAIQEDNNCFANGIDPQDDITIVVIKRKP